ncbi:uncharacterized protein DS421_18g608750 [Arachis hypogaea]|nr:uncharacterized protein DS421_18g608750 [Arachis hypogaea]
MYLILCCCMDRAYKLSRFRPLKKFLMLDKFFLTCQVSNFYSVYLLITHNQISMNKNLKLEVLFLRDLMNS